MTKRNQKTVVDTRWAKKEQTGRVVKDETHSYIATPISAKNQFQIDFIKALKSSQIVVVDAPAGVGKSFVAMSEITDWLKKGWYNKVYLSRPAVGMGNTLGMLRGGLREKYEPFLLPLVDVICERYGMGFYESSLENGTIEYCPLEYIRGRNISAVAVVDEFQNVKPHEAYTLITRIAQGGKLVCIGDSTQTDIVGQTGLEWLYSFIERHNLQEHVKIIKATSDDIVRGDWCKEAVKARELDRKNGINF